MFSLAIRSFYLYEISILLISALLFLTGCGKDEGGASARAAQNNSAKGSNGSGSTVLDGGGGGSTSVPGTISSSADQPQLSDSQLKQALEEVLGSGNGIMDLLAEAQANSSDPQKAGENLGQVLQMLAVLMSKVDDKYAGQMQALFQKIAQGIAKLRQGGILKSKIAGLIDFVVNIAKQLITKFLGPHGIKASVKDLDLPADQKRNGIAQPTYAGFRAVPDSNAVLCT
jgi:hypothetical protein